MPTTRSQRRRNTVAVAAAVVSVISASLLIAPLGPATGGASDCPGVVDASKLASEQQLRDWTARSGDAGLRTTGSAVHKRFIDWLEREMRSIPGVSTRSLTYPILRWQPVPQEPGGGRSLAKAGALRAGGESLPVTGAIPYAKPGQATGPLVYLPKDQPITTENSRGKIVVRDFPDVRVPYAQLFALSNYVTPDLAGEAGNDYDHGPFADEPLHNDLVAAGMAGAAGLVSVFDFPRKTMRGYYEPHKGTHYRMPAVSVGVDEGEQLKRLAAAGASAQVSVNAEIDRATTRTLIATLPGMSSERIVLDSNTDGNTWVQENGHAAQLALAHYLAALPIACRPRTIEFVLATGHLNMPTEGSELYARTLDAEYDAGSVAFAFTIEHLGTREINPVPRTTGPGRDLRFTGLGEFYAWFTSESPILAQAAIDAVKRRGLDRTAVMRGADAPVAGRVPAHCSFGGLGGHFHGHLIPTMAMISGPWSQWAPGFGERAIDFGRMRAQVLAAGDALLALDDVPREEIAGPFIAYRQARAAGAPTCSHELPPEQAPGS